MDDDLMPNDGTFIGGVPREPVEQTIARQKEKAHTLEAVGRIQKVIEHFDTRIAFRDSLASIEVDLSKDPLLHQKMCETNQMVKVALEEEKKLLEDLLEVHAPSL